MCVYQANLAQQDAHRKCSLHLRKVHVTYLTFYKAYWSSKMVWVSLLDPSHLFEREMIQNFILMGGKVGIHRNSLDHVSSKFCV